MYKCKCKNGKITKWWITFVKHVIVRVYLSLNGEESEQIYSK